MRTVQQPWKETREGAQMMSWVRPAAPIAPAGRGAMFERAGAWSIRSRLRPATPNPRTRRAAPLDLAGAVGSEGASDLRLICFVERMGVEEEK
jgi:hypothetical protein